MHGPVWGFVLEKVPVQDQSPAEAAGARVSHAAAATRGRSQRFIFCNGTACRNRSQLSAKDVPLLDQRQTKRGGEAGLTGGRHAERAGAVQPLHPAELERVRGERGAELPGRVRTALAPVETGAEAQTATGDSVEVDPELAQPLDPDVGDVLVGDEAAREEGVHQRRAEPAREVVVAGARGAQRVDPRRLAERADRLARRDARKGFERLRDLRPAQREVAPAAAALGGDEAAADAPCE